ncbi:MAG: HAD family hydrolase [Deltaproteobacteria bacterium]|nr:MAG: HAD family hydrolase [Deltaproteobacteria bacterium]
MRNNRKLTAVIWDWNGTLLNDVKVSLLSVNEELAARNLPQISENFYRSHFDFPVKDFYQKLGINFSRDNFDEMSRRFLETYFRNLQLATLHEGVEEVLQFLKDHGIRQYVLSAMEQKRLEKMLAGYGIDHFFEKIQGLDDIYADGKRSASEKLIETIHPDKSSTWMVGDTLHDLDVANAMGIHCVLLSSGHQTRERLLRQHDRVVNNYREIKEFFALLI